MIFEGIQNFPAGIGQTDVTLRAVNVIGVQESPYSLIRETQLFPGARWELEIALIPSERKDAQRIEAFLLSLRGRAGRFRLGDPYRSMPLGTALGSPIVTEALAGSEVITSRGWTPSRAGLLLAGDFIEIDQHLHMTLADVNSDATGAASLSVWPALREQSFEYTPIVTRNARGLFALDANSIEFTRNVDGYNTAMIKAVEVIEPRQRLNAKTVALFGDSITNFATSYSNTIVIADGGGNGLNYQIRASVANPHLVSIEHVNAGASQTLLVTWAANKLTVRLATNGAGAVTSTIQDVATAVIATAGDKFIVLNLFGPTTTLAVVSAQKWAFDFSYNAPNSPWVWAQAFMRGRFDFARRRIQYNSQYYSSTEGDWDWGYPGWTAQDLILNPGPMGDVLGSVADLIVGNAGANDLLLGATAPQIRDRVVAEWDRLDAAGRSYIWTEVPPSGDAGRTATATAANALLRPIAGARGIRLLRWKESFYAGGSVPAVYMPDGTHPSDLMCYEQGLAWAEDLDAYIQPSEPDYSHAYDPAWITANPTMLGDAAGLASGWLNHSPGLVTPSKTGDGTQQLVFTQSAGSYAGGQVASPTATTGFAPGDVIEGVFLVKVHTEGLDMKALETSLYFAGVSMSPSTSAMKAESYDPYRWQGTYKPGLYLLRTPPCRVPHGATGVSNAISGFGNGTVEIIVAGVRRSTQPI
ncbi:MAG: hypothetical protein JWO82_3506 [Akkermansiaceae bacterium]|nr:hypothetical protein [Akkermansiaceae bacterium]